MTRTRSERGDFRYFRGDGLELAVCRQSSVSYPLHNHISVFTLGLVLDGTLELATDSGTCVYRKNGTFLIPPYAPHRISARSHYTLLSLCIDKGIVTGGGLENTGTSVADFLRGAGGQPMLESGALSALCDLAPALRAVPPQGESAIGRLRARLKLEPERRYSIDDMAALAFAGKYNLIRSFKKEVGLTPHQFQIQNRVRRGQRLLEASVPAAEAALAAGFCDQSHFIRHFKRIVGLTPAEYTRACRVVPRAVTQGPE